MKYRCNSIAPSFTPGGLFSSIIDFNAIYDTLRPEPIESAEPLTPLSIHSELVI